jgi:hypothetical protein
MRRTKLMLLSIAVVLSVLVTFTGPASATSGTVSCSHLSKGDNNAGDVVLSGCSDFANTGGSGAFSMQDLMQGKFVVHWANGKATSVTDQVAMYIGDGCKISYDLYYMQGMVLKDQTGSVTGPASAYMCDSPNGFKLIGQFNI